MSNWSGKSRSNYFRVKDPEAFTAEMEALDLSVQEHHSGGRFVVISETEFGDWPTTVVGEDGDDEDVCIVDAIAGHLVDGEVAVIESVGSEKHCYLTGVAVAFNSKGEHESICLREIYDRAQRLAGEGVSISVAEY